MYIFPLHVKFLGIEESYFFEKSENSTERVATS